MSRARGPRVRERVSNALEARYRARSLWLDGLAEPLVPRPRSERRSRLRRRDRRRRLHRASGPPTSWRRCSPTCASPSSSARSRASARRAATAAGPRPAWPAARTATHACAARTRCAAASAPWPTRWARSGRSSQTRASTAAGCTAARCSSRRARPRSRACTKPSQRRRAFGMERRRLARCSSPPSSRSACACAGREPRRSRPTAAASIPHGSRAASPLACERRGVMIYEGTAAEAIEPGRVRCTHGTLRAGIGAAGDGVLHRASSAESAGGSCRSTRS